MDASPKRKRKSVKGRRRSLRNLQPAEYYNDFTAISQPVYGSMWIDQAETPPIPVRKPRRNSVYNAQISHHIIINKENLYKHLEKKETFISKSTPPKMVEDAPKKTPVLCPTKGSDYSPQNVWNNENIPEEIRVAHFGGQRSQDASISDESLAKTRYILSIDEMNTQYQDEKVNHSIKDELQVSDYFSEQNKMNLQNKSLSPDQLTAESLIEPVTSLIEKKVQPFPRSSDSVRTAESLIEPVTSLIEKKVQPFPRSSDSVRSCSGSTDNLVFDSPSLTSLSETPIHHSCLSLLSGERISSVPQKDSLPFSTDLCQDFQQLDISVCTENDLQATTLNEEFVTLNENSLASDSSLLDNDFSLNRAFLQTLESCYPDEVSSDVSALNDSTLSEGCDVWETDISSAGSELSDSWCFSRHFNSANDFNSPPCKTDNAMAPKINNNYFVESAKHLIFATEDDLKKEHDTVGISSLCIPMKEGENLPAIEYLSLDYHLSPDLNKEHQTHVHEKSPIEGTEFCMISNDVPIKDEFVNTFPPKNLHRNSTQKIPDSKIPKVKPSLKGAFLSKPHKTTDNSKKSSSNQSTLTTMDNKSFKKVTKFTSTRTEKLSATVNIEKADKYSTDPNKLKSSTCLNKTLNGKKGLTLGKQRSSQLTSTLEETSRTAIKVEESKSQFQPRAVSPEILIFDTLKTPPQMSITQTMKSKAKTFNSVNQLTKSPSAEKQNTSKKSSKSLPTVEMPCQDRNLNESLLSHTSCQEEDSKQVNVSTDEVNTKTYSDETLSKQKWLKGNNASAFNPVSSVPTSAAKTKRRSLDSFATSTITIRRPNTRTKIKYINTTCDAEAQPDFVSEKNITKRPITSQWKKLRRLPLLVPLLATDDVAVVDLESSALTSSDNDSTISDDIFNKKVTTKRRCQSVGSAYFSTENSLLNDDEAVLSSTYVAISHGASDGDNKETSQIKKESDESVGLTEEPHEMFIDNISLESPHLTFVNDKKMRKATRGKRKSLGSVPAKESQKEAARRAPRSDSPPSVEPVKILNESLLAPHSRNQNTLLRRSTRRSSIELSLSSNAKPLSAVDIKGKNKTSTFAQWAEKSFDSHEKMNDDDMGDDEHLREIYAKKPYVPFSPSRLETIYSPNKKRGDTNVFSKRKTRRALTFIPSETKIKNRQKKAMWNWPSRFMVPDADEKLNKLLNFT